MRRPIVALRAGLAPAAIAAALCLPCPNAQAAQAIDRTPTTQPAPVPAPVPRVDEDGLAAYLAEWQQTATHARETQPHWSSPLATTTGLLEQRVRFDVEHEHSGNGTDTTELDGGRGVDLIVSDTNEVQIAADPYYIRSGVPGTGPKNKGAIAPVSGFADWTFLRVEQRLASAPAGAGNYVLTTWLQIQAPAGITALSSHSWQYVPTLAFGKGWGAFDIQGTVAAVLPASHSGVIGYQEQSNLAFQYHVLRVLWPEIEVNHTWYLSGQRGGLNQVYLTPGLVVGRFSLTDTLKFTFGVGYQVAITPNYRAKPQTPAYNHAWLFTTRLNF